MAAILKILKWHLLPKGKSDSAETWWEALVRHGDSELLELFHLDIRDGRHAGHFQILQTTIPSKS